MEIVNYVLNSAAVAKMSDIYMKLDIDGVDDVAGAAEVHSAKMIVVKHRTAINKLRLSTNKNAQDFIKTNNKNAAVLIDLLAPIETHLKNEEDKITKEKERIQSETEAAEKALVQKRVDALLKVDLVMSFFDIAMLSDDEYTTLLDNATKEHQARQDRLVEERKSREA
ncbi:MAG: hypothetical protein KAV87_68630, partial [Desulfobacteraceae bacterium]|nr:hypothetical protein [Desulfobacteraceae bacterium]